MCFPGAVGGVYAFSRAAAANLREKDDHWNEAIGGFLGGSILGLRSRLPSTPPPRVGVKRDVPS